MTLEDESRELVEDMIQTFYSGDYVVNYAAKDAADYEPHAWVLVEHAHLYAMGDKFGFPRLKSCALAKTALDLGRRKTWADDILPAARVVWSTTPSSDRALRNEYIKHILVMRTAMMRDKDENVLKARIEELCSVPELEHDLLMAEWGIESGDTSSVELEKKTVCYACDYQVLTACENCESADVSHVLAYKQ